MMVRHPPEPTDEGGNLRVIVTCDGEPLVFDLPAARGCTVEDVRRAMFAFAAALSTRRARLRGLFERVKRAVSPP
jgi:hypothetical protein